MPPECGAVFEVRDVYSGTGRIDLVLEGPEQQLKPFLKESGGHRWQRVPPTERSGRVHTSTVTVVVMPIAASQAYRLRDQDLHIETMRGQGAGGQHRNVTDSAVRMRHLPTGLEVKICVERSQHRNRDVARELLEARVALLLSGVSQAKIDQERRELAGSGQRGDKIRTIRVRDNQVVDHRSGSRLRLDAFMSGELPR